MDVRVSRVQHDLALSLPLVEQLQDPVVSRRIDARHGLVQQDHVGLLRDRPRDEGRRCCPPESSRICRSARSRCQDAPSHAARLSILRRRRAQPSRSRIPAHHHDIAHRHRELPVDVLPLRDVRHIVRACGRSAASNSVISPDVSGISPAIAFSRVLLPEPFGPTMLTTWLRGISASTWLRITRRP